MLFRIQPSVFQFYISNGVEVWTVKEGMSIFSLVGISLLLQYFIDLFVVIDYEVVCCELVIAVYSSLLLTLIVAFLLLGFVYMVYLLCEVYIQCTFFLMLEIS